MLHKDSGEPTLSRTQVFEWHTTFGEGREIIERLPNASRSFTTVTDDNIEKVYQTVFENRSIDIKEINNTSYGLGLMFWI